MIEITDRQIDRVNLILGGMGNGSESVLKNAINRGLSSVRVQSVRSITKMYDITQKDIKADSTIYLRKAAGRDLAGHVSFSGMRIPLYKFNVTPREPSARRVKASVLKSSSPTSFTDAFIARMKNGHTGVFERTRKQGIEARVAIHGESKHTEKIRELFGPATAQMARNAVVLEHVEKEAQHVIDIRIEHEMDRILKGYS